MEYKYIVYLANGTLGYWQPGPNGTLDLEAAGGARFQVTEGWCDTPRQIEVFSPVPTAPAAPQVGAGDRGGAGAAAGRGLRLLKARVSAAGRGWERGWGRAADLAGHARGLHGSGGAEGELLPRVYAVGGTWGRGWGRVCRRGWSCRQK